MTKEQAVEVLRSNTNLGYGIVIENESTQLIKEAIEMAIKALEQNTVSQETYDSEYLARKQAEQELHEIQQNTSDDCVSREQALLALTGKNLHLMNAEELILLFDKRIKALPSVTPTRKSGLHWIERFDNESMWLECPHCHMDSIAAYNYCPNCGASFKKEKRGNK